ncbi:MAG: hypothetical protein A3E01_00610 [Gammaproteobacteria bacterium RIFCSPHIGHO2_12_FULL_63_22]|nr:MAG: hypothetical protein A3E01_00610 [Gammaproteobacteria bacterium RIFCSPHIGHO2_12_FULL_63_22]
MARLSATTNPTNLVQIDREDVCVDVVNVDGVQHAFVREFKTGAYQLPEDCVATLIARSGNTSLRFDLGNIGAWSAGPYSLSELDKGHLRKFRILVRKPGEARLTASVENIRPKGEGDLESLLPIVSTDLGQRLWRVTIDEDGATLECNSRIFPNGESAQSYPPFRTLVLAEALRQVLQHLAADPERMATEGSVWMEWAAWMPSLGISPNLPAELDARAHWVEESTAAFCDRFSLASDLEASLSAAENNS